MAIGDAGKLGSAISKHKGNLDAALQEYQEERMAQTAKEVCTGYTSACISAFATPVLVSNRNAGCGCC